jgi:hypothetical protein
MDEGGEDDTIMAAQRGAGQARDDPAVMARARLCMDLCPICWMPLVTDNRYAMDRKWGAVSATFKGKPAFSIKHPDKSRSLARHVFAFGMNALADGKRNFQKSHYVHYCMVGNADSIMSYWTLYDGSVVAPSLKSIFRSNEVHKLWQGIQDVKRLEAVDEETLLNLVCVENGVFKNALANESKMGGYIYDNSDRLNHQGVADIIELMKNRTFTACCDCNTSMTLSAFMESLFELVFLPSVCANRHGYSALQKSQLKKVLSAFGLESMVHCVMLSGVLHLDELTTSNGQPLVDGAGKRCFLIQDSKHRATWRLRFVLVWCSLQILTCLWKFYDTDARIGHHKSYVYVAIADFYFSLLFYALHEGLRLGNAERGSLVGFETFNFFYSSHFPFFLRSSESNLSMCVMQLTDVDRARQRFKVPDFVNTVDAMALVRQQMQDILDAAFDFWTVHVTRISNTIHSGEIDRMWNTRNPVEGFFVSPSRVERILRELQDIDVPLNINTFATVLHPTWYWFHFKHITMPRISSLCKQYDTTVQTISAQGTRIWRRWYRMFDASVRALQAVPRQEEGVRALLVSANELRALGVARR